MQLRSGMVYWVRTQPSESNRCHDTLPSAPGESVHAAVLGVVSRNLILPENCPEFLGDWWKVCYVTTGSDDDGGYSLSSTSLTGGRLSEGVRFS